MTIHRMSKSLALTLAGLLFLLVSVAEAQITANVTSGCPPLIVNFTGPNDTWNFGNGAPVVAGPNPSRIYNLPGTYTVSRAGAPGFTLTITVFDLPNANFSATTPTSGCASVANPLVVTFQDNSTTPSGTIVSWAWDFGDGNVSTLQNPTHNYNSPGTYTVSLRVRTNNGCEDTEVKTAFVNANGAINVTFNPTQSLSCAAPHSVQFTNTTTGIPPGSTILWEFFNFDGTQPNGIGAPVAPSINTSAANPLVTFNNLGDYTVRLRITDPSGCVSTLVRSQMVRLRQYGLSFTSAIQPGVGGSCNPVPVQFTNTFTNVNQPWQTVTWQFLNSSNVLLGTVSGQASSAPIANPLFNFPGSGTYTIRVSAQGSLDNCPIQTSQQTITIGALPQASFINTDSTSCQVPFSVTFNAAASLNASTYEWDFDGNGTVDATTVNPTFNYTTPGTYNVRLTVRDTGGCSSTLTKTSLVRILPLNPGFIAQNPNGCNDLGGNFTVNFVDTTQTVTTITNWTWQFFDSTGTQVGTVAGSNPSIHQNPSFTFNTDTSVNRGRARYSVRLIVTTVDGCIDTVFVPNAVRVGNRREAAFTSAPPFGCANTPVNFTYTGSAQYDSLYWFPFGFGGPPDQIIAFPSSPNYTFTYNGDPNVYVAGLIVWNGGCADSTDYSATNPRDPRYTQLLPMADFSFSVNNCDVGEMYFVDQSMGAQKWVWQFGDTANTVISDSITKYLPGNPPISIRNPVFTYGVAGNYNVTLTVSHDNVFLIRDSLGNTIPNAFFTATGNPFTYQFNSTGDSLLIGPFTTGDSVQIIRCTQSISRVVTVPPGPDQFIQITSSHDSSQANCFGDTVLFNLTTVGVGSVFWDFGNGQTSSDFSPTAIYSEPGIYSVTVVIVTNDGCKFSKVYQDLVRINGPRLNFDYCESEACVGENIQFVDNSTSVASLTTRTWDMGNGTIFSSDPFLVGATFRQLDSLRNFNYFYTLPLPGSQIAGVQLKLSLTDSRGCTATDSLRIRPTQPVIGLTIDQSPRGCSEDSVSITVASTDANGYRPFRIRYEVYDTLSPANLLFSSGPGVSTQQSFILAATNDSVARFYDLRVIVEDFKYYDQGTGCTSDTIVRLGVFPGTADVGFTFVADTNACPPRLVQFFDATQPAVRNGDTIQIVSWLWNFGDGTTSTLQNPSKIYSIPNQNGYTITLTVTDEAGCVTTRVIPDTIVIKGVDATYTAQEVSPTLGAVLSTGSIINFVQGPFNPLPYTIRFNAVLANPSDSALVLGYVWDFGDGNLGTGNPVNYTYNIPGSYTPQLIIQSSDGCNVAATNSVGVIANGCPPPRILGDSIVCVGETFQLVGLPPTGSPAPPYTNPTWRDLGSGGIIGNTDTITATLSVSTTLQFSLIDSSGCLSFVNWPVTVLPPPTVNAGPDQTECQGSDITLIGTGAGGSGNFIYSWAAVPAIAGLPQNDTITVNNLNISSTFTLTVTDTTTGCSNSDNVIININTPPIANAGADFTLCSGSSQLINASATGGTGNPLLYSYVWSPATGLSNANIRNPIVTGTNLTATPIVRTYVLTVTDDQGCIDVDSLVVTIPPRISITGYPDRTICLGNNTTLNGTVTGGTSPLTLFWNVLTGTAGSISNPNVANPTLTPTVLTEYVLTVTDNSSCIQRDTVRIFINPPITITAGTDAYRCIGSNVQLNSVATGGTPPFNYSWTTSPSANLNSSTTAGPLVQNIQQNTTLIVTAIDQNSCFNSDTIRIFVSNPVAAAGPSRTICSGDSATFNGNASGGFAPYQYTWLIPTGLSNPTIQNPRVSRINTTGAPVNIVYFLVVRDSINCNSTPDTTVLTVNPIPNSAFTGLDSVYCINAAPVTMIPQSGGGSFTGPGVTGNIFNPAVAGLGLHTISHFISSNGCRDTTLVTVRVSPLPNANFIGLPVNICRNAPPVTLLPATPGGVFSGPGVSATGVFNPNAAGVTGPVTIKYVVNVGGCPDSSTRIVNIIPTPNPSFSGLDTNVCINSGVYVMVPVVTGGTFSGLGVSASTFSTTLAGVGTRFVQYRVTASGCTDSLIKQVIVNPLPNTSFTGVSNFMCVNNPTRLLVPAIPGGVFSGPGVQQNAVTGNYTFNPALADTGTHIIKYVVSLNGCTDSLLRTIRVNRAIALPDSAIIVCEGIPVRLGAGAISTNGSPVFKFSWRLIDRPDSLPVGFTGLNNDDLLDSLPDPRFLGTNPDGLYRYRLTVVDSTGCVSANDTSQQVRVVPKPFIASRDSIVFCFETGKKTTIEIAPGYRSYYWLQFNDSTPDLEIIQAGYYAYEVTDTTGCRNTDSLYVSEICEPRVFVPNAFTPNGDGLNDKLEIFGKYYTDLELIIFNRWGEVIHVMRAPENKLWDGNYRSEEVPSGTYVYEIKYRSILDGSVTSKRGSVTVIK